MTTKAKTCPICGEVAHTTREITEKFGWRFKHLLSEGPPQSRCIPCRTGKKKTYKAVSGFAYPVESINKLYAEAYPKDKQRRGQAFKIKKLKTRGLLD